MTQPMTAPLSVPASSNAGGLAHPKTAVALLLAALAGSVDAAAYLALRDGFVAHMSGNTVHAAIATAHGWWITGLVRLLPVPGFVIGAGVGRMLADAARARGRQQRLTLVLLGEGALLLLAYIVHRGAPLAALPLTAAAMGLQNAALRHVAGHELRTTFVTGMLVAFADECVAVWVHGLRSQRRLVILHAGVWLAFSVGAILGTLAWAGRGMLVGVPALSLLVVTIVWDSIAPLSPP
jgi:uncharacterized membrane protein YoaK (UPF0700 family)